MFSSSVRRAALTAPQIPIVSLSSATPRAATSQALSHRSRSHQRRCSSSKPPSPADGSKGVSQRQTVPPTAAQSGSDGEKKESTEFSRSSTQTEGSKVVAEGQTGRSDSEKSSAAEGGKKATSRSGRRKGSPKSDMKDEGMRNVPSVPSTQHVAPGRMFLALCFFIAYTNQRDRNLRFLLLLPPPPHFSHNGLPKASDRRPVQCNLQTTIKYKHKAFGSHFNLIKYT